MIDAMSRLPLFSFLWPEMLWLLGFVLVLGAGYVWLDARRRRAAVHYPALRSVGLTTTGGAGWRRHVSPGLALLALSALIFAIARPQAVLMLPSRIDTVMLVMDLSGSMRAQDVKPSRIRAAQQAAKVLLDAQPSGVKVGVVAMPQPGRRGQRHRPPETAGRHGSRQRPADRAHHAAPAGHPRRRAPHGRRHPPAEDCRCAG
jgi:Ca-activated chloride channel family protein